jgi:hypothetical protein
MKTYRQIGLIVLWYMIHIYLITLLFPLLDSL